MSGILFTFNITVFGHLETIVDDWKNVISPIYHIEKPLNFHLGVHSTPSHHPLSHIISPARKAFQELIKNENETLLAFCHFLLLDYICLEEYILPKGCESLVKEVERGREIIAH
jgi:hypothetical protein